MVYIIFIPLSFDQFYPSVFLTDNGNNQVRDKIGHLIR